MSGKGSVGSTPGAPTLPFHQVTMINVYRGHRTGFSRYIYKYLGDDIILLHNKYLKWREDLGTEFVEDISQFGQEHLRIYKVTNVTKYRSFQYRMLQRAIVTNVQLYKWGIKDTSMCTFCNLYEESVIHVFCECEIAMQLWQHVKGYLQNNFVGIEIVSLPK